MACDYGKNEGIAGRLNKVFEALIQTSQVIKDDTLPEKFIEWFQVSYPDKDACIQAVNSTSCTSFLSNCAQTLGKGDECIEIQRYILALRIAAHLGSLCFEHIEGQVETGETQILSHVFGAADSCYGYWCEAAVRNAWINGLFKVAHHPQGFKWSIEKGYFRKSVSCLTDSSIFVSSAAQKLLVYFLVRDFEMPNANSGSLTQNGINKETKLKPHTQYYTDILQECVNPSLEFPSVKKLKVLVGLLEEINSYGEEGKNLLDYIYEEFNIVQQIGRFIQDDHENGIINTECPLLMRILDLAWPLGAERRIVNASQAMIIALPDALMTRKCVSPALTIAAWLIPRSSPPTGEHMQRILLSPMKSFPIESEDITDSVTQQSSKVLTGNGDLKLFSQAVKLAAELDTYNDLFPDLEEHICKALQHTCRSTGMEASVRVSRSNTRVQHLLLETLYTMKSGSNHGSEVLKTALHLLQSPSSPSVVLSKAFQVVSKCLTGFESWDSSVYAELTEVVKKKLCDVKWETRDSAVEFLGCVIQNTGGCDKVLEWMCEERLHMEVWHSMGDGESYVRASALKTLGSLAHQAKLWKDFILLVDQNDILNKVIDICQHDTEAFARRQAVQLLCQWTGQVHFQGDLGLINKVLAEAIHDFDWEVKLLVLNFWEGRLEELTCMNPKPNLQIPAYAANLSPSTNECEKVKITDILERLHENGCLQTLIYGLNDYDQSVQHKACQILTTFKNCFTVQTGQEKSTIVGDSPPIKKLKLDKTEGKQTLEHADLSNRLVKSGADFVKIVNSLDLEEVICSTKSMDFYERNPESLLEDIISSLKFDDEDNFVDCY